MPHPQSTLAQRNVVASEPQPGKERETATRAHWSDRINPVELEAAQLEVKNSERMVACISSKPFHNETRTTSEITSLSSQASQTQPIDTPQTHPRTQITQPISRHPPCYTYKCTLCWKEYEPPCYTVGPDSRIVCLDCWRWIHSVSICWKCNEVVYRKEDAISFGWC